MGEQADDLDVLVRTCWRELHSMLTAVTGDRATAEDLTQEVFVLAVRRGLRPGPGARTWFRRAGRFLALNAMRRRRPLPLSPDDLERMHDRVPCEGSDDPAFEESLAALRLCMDELKASDRSLLAARYERREPLESVAIAVEQSVGYLKQRLFRLRLRLRACVKKRLGFGNEAGQEDGNIGTDSVPA